ncbi:translation initiation factor IF-2 subunit beta [Candidatus Micrarchaeota archaeon CG1_02_55_22]|nr:MAG: translation initiation factor IF-2 subunit beta [Candidatus Micrarchaeota archaeon CG1_02_55_22]
MDSYESLLERAYAKMPARQVRAERFGVPAPESLVTGSRTVVKNFDAICSYLRRKPNEVARFLLKELAVPGVVEGPRLVLQGKFSQRSIAERLAVYVKERVMCRECNRPDTNLVQLERNIFVLKCEACGASSPVRS